CRHSDCVDWVKARHRPVIRPLCSPPTGRKHRPRRNHAISDPTVDRDHGEATALLGAPAVLAQAAAPTAGAHHAVFAQTDDPAGNAIVAYARHHDGTLTFAGTYATGGNGAPAAAAAVDPLASPAGRVHHGNHAVL